MQNKKAISKKKKLRFHKFPDTCGRCLNDKQGNGNKTRYRAGYKKANEAEKQTNLTQTEQQ